MDIGGSPTWTNMMVGAKIEIDQDAEDEAMMSGSFDRIRDDENIDPGTSPQGTSLGGFFEDSAKWSEQQMMMPPPINVPHRHHSGAVNIAGQGSLGGNSSLGSGGMAFSHGSGSGSMGGSYGRSWGSDGMSSAQRIRQDQRDRSLSLGTFQSNSGEDVEMGVKDEGQVMNLGAALLGEMEGQDMNTPLFTHSPGLGGTVGSSIHSQFLMMMDEDL